MKLDIHNPKKCFIEKEGEERFSILKGVFKNAGSKYNQKDWAYYLKHAEKNLLTTTLQIMVFNIYVIVKMDATNLKLSWKNLDFLIIFWKKRLYTTFCQLNF